MIFLLLGLNLALASTGSIAFDADYAAFREKEKLNYIEIYYAIPYSQLDYEVVSDSILARYKVSISVKEINLTDSSFHKAVIPSFETAQERDLKIIEQFGFFALPGSYHFTLTISQAQKSGSVEEKIVVRDLSTELSLSDIELAAEIKSDTTGGRFTKQALRVVPNPSRAFGQAYSLLQVYIEIYNLEADSGYYELSYRILNDSLRPVKSFPPQTKPKLGTNLTEAFGISAAGLKPGPYYLQVEVTDSPTGEKASVDKKFSISAEKSRVVKSDFTPDEQAYYRDIEYWADQTELSEYAAVNETGKEQFLKRFWQQHDLKEFIERVKYADEQFRFGREQGRKTDRGRIYLKYGPPSDIDSYTMSEGYKPLESWLYYEKGYRFLFVDLSGSGNFRLIYTNHPKERSDPNWQRYVDPTLLDEFE